MMKNILNGSPVFYISISIAIVCLIILIVYTQKLKKDQQVKEARLREEAEKRIAFVRETSSKLKAVHFTNRKYSFFNIPGIIYLQKTCSSKSEYDHTNYKSFLISQILSDLQKYEDLIDKVERNATSYNEYSSICRNIMRNKPADESYYIYYDYYESVETALYTRELLQHPVIDLKVKITKQYISPGGRNSYQDSHLFSLPELKACINEAKQARANQETAKYQRDVMTASLRYDILKRDGFKCTICGATQADGVKLHVDHIIPVSKGGKTVPRNLRTLCDRCNMGKRDKYDPNGIN